MPKRKRKKHKATKEQLKNLAKGRKIRAVNLRKQHRRHPRRHPRKTVKPKRTMAKRRRIGGESLTGGTGDVNPQLFSMTLATTVADQPITFGWVSPISRMPKFGSQATVLEVLKVYFYFSFEDIAVNAETAWGVWANLGTKDWGITPKYPNEPTTFASAQVNGIAAYNAGGIYRYGQAMPITVDLTDGAGHGVLVASDYIYVQFDTDGYGAVSNCKIKVLYRFKNVPLVEFIGIVQSQQ